MSIKILTREEIIERAKLIRDDDNIENTRILVCSFYGDRCCSLSSDPEKSCSNDECVLECKSKYLSKIFTRPQEHWTEEFEIPLVRDKKDIKEIIEIGLNCNTCYMSDKCHLFAANNMCAIEWGDDSVNTDPKDMVDKLILLQYKRITRSQKFEEIDGGVPDAGLSTEMDRLTGLLSFKNELSLNKFSLNITGQTQNQGGGILSQLFGGMNKPAPQEAQVTDVSSEVIPIEENATSLIDKKIEFTEDNVEGVKLTRKQKRELKEK